MKYLLFLSLLILSTSSFAEDTMICTAGPMNGGVGQGTFNGTLPNGEGMLFTFTLTDGRLMVASFNNCVVILDKNSKIKKVPE